MILALTVIKSADSLCWVSYLPFFNTIDVYYMKVVLANRKLAIKTDSVVGLIICCRYNF